MVDLTPLPPRLSPFAALFAATANDPNPGVTLSARSLDQVQIDCAPDRTEKIALPLPAPGRAVSHDGMRLISLAPGRWIVVKADAPDLFDRVRDACDGSVAAVVDQGHGRSCLRLSGANARDLLATGTGIDLHPRAFAVDDAASTALFHVAATLDRRQGSATFDLHMARSYGAAVAERLIAGGRQYGVAVAL